MALKTFLRSKLGISAVAIIVIIAGGITINKLNSKATPDDLIKVMRGDIVQEVIVTGKITPVNKLDLAFEQGGKIARVLADVGDEVRSGEALIELDSTQLNASLKEAEATSKIQKAKLDELVRGTRQEDIQITKTDLLNAEQDLANEYNGVTQSLNDAYAKTDDAVRYQLSALFTNGDGTNPQLTFYAIDPQAKIDAESGRAVANIELDIWKSEIAVLSSRSSNGALEETLKNTGFHLEKILSFINRVMDAVVSSPSAGASTYKTSVTAARTAVNTATLNINTKSQTIASKKIAIEQVKNKLALQIVGSTIEDIHAQEAQLAQAEANVAVARVQLAQTVLRSPVAGVVAKMDGKVGEVASAYTLIASVISKNNFQIDADVPEVDIGKISLQNDANITFDAFQGEVFSGKIVKINPSETIIEGVPTYKIELLLTYNDPRIKPGMTANISIEVARAANALSLLSRAIFEKDGQQYVSRKLANGSIEEIAVEIGIRGTNGEVEIRSGVQEGDTVVIPQR